MMHKMVVFGMLIDIVDHELYLAVKGVRTLIVVQAVFWQERPLEECCNIRIHNL